MDKFNELTTGAKLVLGATIAFLIVSLFSWYSYSGPGEAELEAIGADTGLSMWHGVGWIAGLLAIALIVWQAIRLANIEIEIGVTPAMITAALAALMLLFTVIRVIDGYTLADRTIWLWLGLVLAVVTAVGAWMNMQAAGEGLGDIRASVSGAAAAAKGAVDRDDKPAAAAPATPEPPAAAPVETSAAVPPPPPSEPIEPDDAPRAS
jgi:hypothetical protein